MDSGFVEIDKQLEKILEDYLYENIDQFVGHEWISPDYYYLDEYFYQNEINRENNPKINWMKEGF